MIEKCIPEIIQLDRPLGIDCDECPPVPGDTLPPTAVIATPLLKRGIIEDAHQARLGEIDVTIIPTTQTEHQGFLLIIRDVQINVMS